MGLVTAICALVLPLTTPGVSALSAALTAAATMAVLFLALPVVRALRWLVAIARDGASHRGPQEPDPGGG